MSVQGLPRTRSPLCDRHICALAAVIVATLCAAVCADQARAVILPAVTIDGPSQEIVGFGGVAMAEDGTGGLVYLKRVDGVPHVFVSRYVGGQWQAPMRVDTEEPFAASWPRIAAAEGGRLVVVWATPYATEEDRPVYELVGATLGPGAAAFGPAQIIDFDVREATGLSPDLVMSSTGYADVVYRVVHSEAATNKTLREIPLLRTGDVIEEVRVAHYGGERWSRLGEINRDPGLSMRPPSEANAPKIAIGPTGNAIVVWQEPEIEGVARIWARRLFGSTLDYVLPVSASSYDGRAIGQDADAPNVVISRLGQAEVAYRQSVGPGSPLPGPGIFLNTLPDGESASGAEFQGAILADTAVSGGAGASIGPPSLDVNEQRELRLLYDSNGTPRLVVGTDLGLGGTLTLGPSFSGAEQASASVMNPNGGGISAWPSADAAGHPGVAVLETLPSGGAQTALLGGGAGGEVAELSVGRSGLGDGLVAFRQGQLGDASIVAVQITTPPAGLALSLPRTWTKPAQAVVSWQSAASANGPVQYSLVLDGHALPVPAGEREAQLDPHRLTSGHHRVQLLATDADGQSTLSPPSPLLVESGPPSVAIAKAARGAGVSVVVKDPYSGLDKGATTVSFGDGDSAHGRARYEHRYAHAGIYAVSVHVRSSLGNEGNVTQLVSVR
jgi:hypothetical protein